LEVSELPFLQDYELAGCDDDPAAEHRLHNSRRQVLRDVTDAPADEIATERAKVATEGDTR
jgi:hypothetical protein